MIPYINLYPKEQYCHSPQI